MKLKGLLQEYVDVDERVKSYPTRYHEAKEEKYLIGQKIRDQNVISVDDMDAFQEVKNKIEELEKLIKTDEKRRKELEKEITSYFKNHNIEDRTLTTMIGEVEYQFYLDIHSDKPSYQKYPKNKSSSLEY